MTFVTVRHEETASLMASAYAKLTDELSGCLSIAGALGAAFAYQNRNTVSLTGDGAFAMLMGDFTTAVKYQLPVVVVVYNNSELSMISHEQVLEKFPKCATEFLKPDFAAFAENSGGIGIRITEPKELKPAFRKSFKSKKPVLIDVPTDPNQFWIELGKQL